SMARCPSGPMKPAKPLPRPKRKRCRRQAACDLAPLFPRRGREAASAGRCIPGPAPICLRMKDERAATSLAGHVATPSCLSNPPGLNLPTLATARTDILALTLDDLVAFSNRGTVKRALKE